MTMKINEMPSGHVGISAPHRGGITIDHGEQAELLEALARTLGYTLVDREERKSLLALTEEVDEDDNDYSNAATAWNTWQDRAEALAAAVNQLFDTREA